jgi:phosphatidylglycerol:prolipoprotein diacylglycerol transferase
MYYAIRKKVPLLKGMDIIAPCLMIGLAFGRIGCYLNGCCYGEECTVSWGAAFPYGSNAFVEQYENGELSVPRELTDPNRPDANGRPGLVTRQQLRDSYAKLDDPLLHLSQEERAKRKSEIERQQRLMDTLRAKPVHPTELYSAFNSFLVAAALVAFFSLAPAPGRVFALMLLLEGASRYILEMLRVEPPVFGTKTQSFSMILSATFVVIGAVMWFACGALSDTTPRKHAPASA